MNATNSDGSKTQHWWDNISSNTFLLCLCIQLNPSRNRDLSKNFKIDLKPTRKWKTAFVSILSQFSKWCIIFLTFFCVHGLIFPLGIYSRINIQKIVWANWSLCVDRFMRNIALCLLFWTLEGDRSFRRKYFELPQFFKFLYQIINFLMIIVKMIPTAAKKITIVCFDFSGRLRISLASLMHGFCL